MSTAPSTRYRGVSPGRGASVDAALMTDGAAMDGAPEDGGGRRGWRWIGGLALLIPAAWALWTIVSPLLAPAGAALGPVRGVRLGMGAAQVRDRLVTGAPGDFRSEVMGEDYALTWRPSGAPAELKAARLELHLGQLVAVRLTLDPAAPESRGPDFEISNASVLTRTRGDEAVELTWLARSCPTHAGEVRRLIEEHSQR